MAAKGKEEKAAGGEPAAAKATAPAAVQAAAPPAAAPAAAPAAPPAAASVLAAGRQEDVRPGFGHPVDLLLSKGMTESRQKQIRNTPRRSGAGTTTKTTMYINNDAK